MIIFIAALFQLIMIMQMELLKKTGCDIVQGYYFSKPVPPEEFNALIEKEIQTEQEEASC